MQWTLYGEKDENITLNEMNNLENKWKELISEETLNKNKKYLKICIYGIILGIIIVIAFFNFGIFSIIGFFIIIVSGLAYYSINLEYKNTSKDILKLKIAKENNWYYLGERNKNDQYLLAQKIPELFRKGNTHNKYIDDQFFGNFKINNTKIPFHFGNFYYEIRTRSKDREHTTPYYQNFFAFKITDKVNNQFLVGPEGIFSKFTNAISKKDIDLESHEFNKEFKFHYKVDKLKAQREITKIFTPTMQVNFLDLEKKRKNFTVLFDKDYIIFMFDGFLLKKFRTNFLKEKTINPADRDQLIDKTNELNEIIKEIMKSIN